MVYQTDSITNKSIQLITPPPYIDSYLEELITTPPFPPDMIETYTFWRFLTADKIPLQKASTFLFRDIDYKNLQIAYRKRCKGKRTGPSEFFPLSNKTGIFLSVLIWQEYGKPIDQHYKRSNRRLFPPRRTIETNLQKSIKTVGYDIPNRDIPFLDLPTGVRDMKDWRNTLANFAYNR